MERLLREDGEGKMTDAIITIVLAILLLILLACLVCTLLKGKDN